MQKSPALFADNAEFCDKWVSIVNKCSYDLMLLVIEHAMSEVNVTNTEITRIEGQIQNDINNEERFNNKIKELQEEMKIFESKVKEYKLRKLERDRKDYATAKVYRWRYFTPRKNRNKHISWADQQSGRLETESSDGESSTYTSGDEGSSARSYLDREAKRNQRYSFRGRRGRGRRKT